MEQLINTLREQANELEKLTKAPKIVPDISLAEAVAALADVDQPHVAIALELNRHGVEWTFRWSVWDGANHHYSSSLKRAVEAAVTAYKVKSEQPEKRISAASEFLSIERQIEAEPVPF